MKNEAKKHIHLKDYQTKENPYDNEEEKDDDYNTKTNEHQTIE